MTKEEKKPISNFSIIRKGFQSIFDLRLLINIKPMLWTLFHFRFIIHFPFVSVDCHQIVKSFMKHKIFHVGLRINFNIYFVLFDILKVNKYNNYFVKEKTSFALRRSGHRRILLFILIWKLM